MKYVAFSLSAIALLGSCTSDSAPVTTRDAKKGAADVDTKDKVQMRQESIEKAAEEATRIIEADAKADIDSLEQN